MPSKSRQGVGRIDPDALLGDREDSGSGQYEAMDTAGQRQQTGGAAAGSGLLQAVSRHRSRLLVCLLAVLAVVVVAVLVWVLASGEEDKGREGEVVMEEDECSLLPGLQSLTANAFLPDPFRFSSGKRVQSLQDWAARRQEIGLQLQCLELGLKPPRPSSVSGAVNASHISVSAGEANHRISFAARVLLPAVGAAPFPAMIGVGYVFLNVTRLLQQGVAVVLFDQDDIAQQQNSSSRGKGKFYELYGAQHSAGALMAWAWAVSRIIDVLEMQDAASALINVSRLGVTGCSRNGKGALVIGAFDDRIALTIPQESGSGGVASWRISDWQQPAGSVQTLAEIVDENVWFTAGFKQFSQAADKLPYDHHMLMGLVAPRGLLVLENTDVVWAGNLSCWGDSVAAQLIYEALGVPDAMAAQQLGGYWHCQFPPTQARLTDAFVTRFLLGGAADTGVMQTDALSFSFNASQWIDWEAPWLNPQACRPLPVSLPGLQQLPLNPFLPDPFLFMDSQSRVSSAAQWACRRQEIRAQLQHYELGVKPPRPPLVSGSVSQQQITVQVQLGSRAINFTAALLLPTNGAAPYPAMIGVGFVNVSFTRLLELGIAVIVFNNNEIAQQSGQLSRGKGKFYELYGAQHSAGALMAWAWAVSRIIDVLEMQDGSSALLDASRLGVTGCSRNGKGALVIGAFDDRIALTIPQESGSGGVGLMAYQRVADAARLGADAAADRPGERLVHRVVQAVQLRSGPAALRPPHADGAGGSTRAAGAGEHGAGVARQPELLGRLGDGPHAVHGAGRAGQHGSLAAGRLLPLPVPGVAAGRH